VPPVRHEGAKFSGVIAPANVQIDHRVSRRLIVEEDSVSAAVIFLMICIAPDLFNQERQVQVR